MGKRTTRRFGTPCLYKYKFCFRIILEQSPFTVFPRSSRAPASRMLINFVRSKMADFGPVWSTFAARTSMVTNRKVRAKICFICLACCCFCIPTYVRTYFVVHGDRIFVKRLGVNSNGVVGREKPRDMCLLCFYSKLKRKQYERRVYEYTEENKYKTDERPYHSTYTYNVMRCLRKSGT